MSRLFCLVVSLVVILLTGGCGEKTTAPSEPPKPAPAKKTIAPPPEAESQAAPPPPYVYDPAGRRDPFAVPPAFQKATATGPSAEEEMTPLQRFDPGQLRLIGVIIGKGEPRAMVVAPDGKSYILKKGIKVGKNNGVVIDITPESVVVREKFVDFSGETTQNIVEIELPKREGV